MDAKYTRINPDDFEVREVINIINQNLEYLYGSQLSSSQTVTNLIPYSDFSIISNVDYWKPYNDSVIAVTDNALCAFSNGGIVGVMTPAVATPLVSGQEYTLLLRCRINKPDARINDFFIVDEENNLYRVNHEQLISQKSSDMLVQSFTPQISVENPRFIIASSDVYEEITEPFKYKDQLKESLFIKDKLVLPYIETHKAEYDQTTVYLIDTLQYLLVNFDSEMYYKVSNIKSGDLIGTTYDLVTGRVTTTSLLETYMFNLVNVRSLVLEGSSYLSRAQEALAFFAAKFNESPERGLFPLRDNSLDYNLRLSLIVLDAIKMYKEVQGSYSGTDLNGHPFDIDTMEADIKSRIKSLPSEVYKSKYIMGGYRQGEYFYLDSNGELSSSEVGIVNQLELYRLLLECGVDFNVDSNLKSLMSYVFKGFKNTYLMPDKVKSSDVLISTTRLIIDPAVLYFNILGLYPDKFTEVAEIRKDIMHSLMSIRSVSGLYKYDFSLGGYTYASNQYLESYLEGFEYVPPRTLRFDEVTLFKGSNTNNLSVINSTSGKSISRVEYTVDRVDTALDANEVVSIVSDSFATKEDVSQGFGAVDGELSSTNETISQALTAIDKDLDTLKEATKASNIINTCEGTFYTKTEVDKVKDDLYSYVNDHITDYSDKYDALQETDSGLDKAIKDLKKQVDEAGLDSLSSQITAIQESVTALETSLSNSVATIATLESKVGALESQVAGILEKLEGNDSPGEGDDSSGEGDDSSGEGSN